MIQITAYLRDDTDLRRWKMLGNKSAWLHDKLEEEFGGSGKVNPTRLGDTIVIAKNRVIKTPGEAKEVTDNGGFITKEHSARKKR